MEIVNHFKEDIQQNDRPKHAAFFPKTIFCVIGGKTGSGKTVLMANLLLNEKILQYSDVYIYSPTIYQPTYQRLKERFEKTEEAIKRTTGIDVKIGHFLETDAEIKDPKELNPKTNHIMIFDDVMLSDQTTIKEYFCRGRHSNVNVFYLCQSLHKIAKHCIRDNANIFILFHQDGKTLKYFHETHISGDMDFKEFKSFCDKSWEQEHGFAVINLWEKSYCGRFISNYKFIYVPNQYLERLNITNNYIEIQINTNKYK